MKANRVLCANSSGQGVILLEALDNNKILVLGSSFPASISPNCYTPVDSLSIVVERRKKGVLAVSVRTLYHGQWCTVCFMLPVEWKEDEDRPFVDLEHPFVPRSDRLGQVVPEHLEVIIDDRVYSTGADRTGKVYIPDGNLLCQYLAGDVDAEAVKAAATEHAEEEAARKKLPETLTALGEALKAIERQREHSLNLAAERDKAQNDLQALRVRSDALHHAVSKQWFIRPSVKRVLAKL